MDSENTRLQARLSWLFVGALFVLCGVLGGLQYRWIGEVALADRERLRVSLSASLDRISQDFNTEVMTASRALMPAAGETDSGTVPPETLYAARFAQWKANGRNTRLFSTIALAVPSDEGVRLSMLDQSSGTFSPVPPPAAWHAILERIELRRAAEPGPGRRMQMRPSELDASVLELPRFVRRSSETPGPFPRREADWLILELNLDYVRDTILPELVQRHFGTGGQREYQLEVVARRDPQQVIYRLDPNGARNLSGKADASTGMLDIRFDQIFRPWPGGEFRGGGPEPGGSQGARPEPRRGGGPDAGRWLISVRNRAGSLDAVVSNARWRNLAVTAAILFLMLLTAGALIRFTRNAQRLAQLQMNFVAGVSHELRTPLTVIHTAGYNLRGKIAANPAQVEKYGALIQQESGRLSALVEQVLRFANARAGRVIRNPEAVSLAHVIEETLAASRPEIESSQCVVEKQIDPELPEVSGDSLALKHALQNLVNNAAKYGSQGKWIGISAHAVEDTRTPAVEIRVADHGRGIPPDEQKQVFDAFFRGRQALRDQVHGTGLGLNLAREIVEAHGGTIAVRSDAEVGTEFTVRIPVAAASKQ